MYRVKYRIILLLLSFTISPLLSNAQNWDFEIGYKNWYDVLAQDSVTVVDSMSYSGIYSVRLETPDTEEFSFIGVNGISPEPGTIFKFHFFLPEDTTNIRSISIAAIHDGGMVAFEETLVKELEPGKWNLVEYEIPEHEVFSDLAFNLFSKTKGTPPVFIDLITSDENPVIRPHLSIPGDLRAFSDQESEYRVVWDASFGDDTLKEYRIYRGGESSIDLKDYELVGTTTETEFTEADLSGGVVRIKVSAVSAEEKETFTTTISFSLGIIDNIENENSTPTSFKLYNNYPNPFNPSTQIRYDIPNSALVTLSIFDLSGKLVKTIVNEVKAAGSYSVIFEASDLSSGIYLYRLQAGSYTNVQKMTLIK